MKNSEGYQKIAEVYMGMGEEEGRIFLKEAVEGLTQQQTRELMAIIEELVEKKEQDDEYKKYPLDEGYPQGDEGVVLKGRHSDVGVFFWIPSKNNTSEKDKRKMKIFFLHIIIIIFIAIACFSIPGIVYWPDFWHGVLTGLNISVPIFSLLALFLYWISFRV